ncbi:MAG: hypothetical protein ABSB56_04555 [Nitrososphaerales archaeon]
MIEGARARTADLGEPKYRSVFLEALVSQAPTEDEPAAGRGEYSPILGSSVNETIGKLEKLVREFEARVKDPKLDVKTIDELIAKFDKETKILRESYSLGVLESIKQTSLDTKSVLEETKAETKDLVQATEALHTSSRRLNILTEALVLLTAALSVVGFSTYTYQVFRDEGYSVGVALSWVDLGDFVFIAIIAIGLSIIIWMNRSKNVPKKT